MIQILYFVDKWLNKFLDETTNYIELVDHYMADECKALGFEMDSGASFTEKYGHQAGNIDAFCHIIDQVTDISILGNAIYSSWRYFNHWAYSAKEILYPKNRQWFIVALIRLGELAIRQHRYLLGESHIEHHSVVNKSKGEKNRKIKTHSQSDKIVNWLINRAADYGLTSALYLLGEIYEYGISVEKNLHIAFSYYHQAAQRQHKDAYLKVAQGFKCGRGVSADEKEAIYWYKQAAMIGNAEALVLGYRDNKPILPTSHTPSDDTSKGPRRGRFKFSMVGIKIGEFVTFTPTGAVVRVASDDSVEYEGRIYKLSPFVGTYMPEERRNSSGAYQGAKYFTYNGKILDDLRTECEQHS